MEKNEEFLEKVKDKEKNFGHSYFKRHKKLFIFLIIIIVTGFARNCRYYRRVKRHKNIGEFHYGPNTRNAMA